MAGGGDVTALRWPAAALVAAVALVAAYLALGGRSYAPASVPSPCAARHWRHVSSFSDIENEVALSALDGAACRLHVSQGSLALAFTSSDRLRAFARRHGLSTVEVAAAARDGLERAISDGQKSGAFGDVEAVLLHTAFEHIPTDQLIRLVRGLLG
jgi:hypothetical protein